MRRNHFTNMELSLTDRVKKYLSHRPDTWVNGRDLEELAMQAGFKASNVSRRCRELAEEGLLERELRQGKRVKSVWYKWHNYL